MCVVYFIFVFHRVTLPCAAHFLICAPTNGGLKLKEKLLPDKISSLVSCATCWQYGKNVACLLYTYQVLMKVVMSSYFVM